MKIFREVKGLPEPDEKKEEGEGIPDTEHLEKTDRDENAKTGAAEVTEDVSEKTETDTAEAVSEEKQEQSGEDV